MHLPRLPLGTSPHRMPALLILLVALAAFGAPAAMAQGPATEPTAGGEYSEDQVKAAFLFHFATYAEWPPGALDDEVVFAVLDADPLARELELFARGRTVHDRPVRVRPITSILELRGADVLFIGAGQNRRLPQLMAAVRSPTLVVTDVADGLPEGAMINFQTVGRRVRFEIAVEPAQQAGLNLSSRLLSAAMRVKMSRCWLECRLLDDQTAMTRLAMVGDRVRSATSA